MSHDFARFVQNQLHHAWIFVCRSGQFNGLWPSFNAGERDRLAFSFRNNFLCEAEYIAVLKCEILSLEGARDNLAEIISRFHHRNARHSYDGEARCHGLVLLTDDLDARVGQNATTVDLDQD